MRNYLVKCLVFGSLLVTGLGVAAQSLETNGAEANGSGPFFDTMPAVPVEPDAKLVLGWIENVRLMPGRMLMKAKLDSGAKSSAMHAEDIHYFEKDGRDMVRFTVLGNHSDADSERFVFERPLVREVNIKLRYTSVRDERPAIRLEFCLAGTLHNAVFSLADRSDFNYPILLGREFLKHDILVDSSESFTHKTQCPRT